MDKLFAQTLFSWVCSGPRLRGRTQGDKRKSAVSAPRVAGFLPFSAICTSLKIVKAGSLQCGFWPRNSQILVWKLPWIFGWIFPPVFSSKEKGPKNPQKIHGKFHPGIRSEKFPSDFRRSLFLKTWEDFPGASTFSRKLCPESRREVGTTRAFSSFLIRGCCHWGGHYYLVWYSFPSRPDPTQHPKMDPKWTQNGLKWTVWTWNAPETDPKQTKIKLSGVGRGGGCRDRGGRSERDRENH